MIEFFNEMIAWLQTGIYDFVVQAYAWIIIKVTEFRFAFQLLMLEFSWDVASEILEQLNISSEIQSALSVLDDNTVAHLNFFNVINGINLLLNAYVTRFILRFSGF